MKKLVCTSCGGNLTYKKDNFLYCTKCNKKYSIYELVKNEHHKIHNSTYLYNVYTNLMQENKYQEALEVVYKMPKESYLEHYNYVTSLLEVSYKLTLVESYDSSMYSVFLACCHDILTLPLESTANNEELINKCIDYLCTGIHENFNKFFSETFKSCELYEDTPIEYYYTDLTDTGIFNGYYPFRILNEIGTDYRPFSQLDFYNNEKFKFSINKYVYLKKMIVSYIFDRLNYLIETKQEEAFNYIVKYLDILYAYLKRLKKASNYYETCWPILSKLDSLYKNMIINNTNDFVANQVYKRVVVLMDVFKDEQ